MIDFPSVFETAGTADAVYLAELHLPIILWLSAAQIVKGDLSQPGWIVEVETCADLIQPFKEGMLLGRFLFENRELIVGLWQRLD